MAEFEGAEPMPQPEQEQPQYTHPAEHPRFQELPPDIQQKVLQEWNRFTGEAMEPEAVVSRSVGEQGFWRGMGETLKPQFQRYKELKVKDLKAAGSLLISVLPVIGEGKAFGKGFLGITAEKGMDTTLKGLKFEPIERGRKALKSASLRYNTVRGAGAAAQLLKFEKTTGPAWVKATMKSADVIDIAGAHAKDAFRVVKAGLGAKQTIEQSVLTQFRRSSNHGVEALSENMARKIGVGEIAKLQKAREAGAEMSYMKTLHDAGLKKDIAWFNFLGRWKHRRVIHAAKEAAGAVKTEVNAKIAAEVAGKVAGKNAAVGWVEGKAMQAAPKVIEPAAAVSKSIKFKQVLERLLDLTPDVPAWLSTTTAVGEVVGMHGIDALPATLQLMKNMFEGVKLSKDMARDVLAYTVNYALQKKMERKAAAEVFNGPVKAEAVAA